MLRIGTRPSPMALVQAHDVAALLPVDCEIVPISTLGDIRGAQDKADWVTTLETALVDQQVDLLVHAAKDVPTTLAAGCELAAVPVRDVPYDALCGAASIADIPVGGVVGTGSARRRAWLARTRPDVLVETIRGNVDTRLARLAGGDLDAIVVSLSGLQRIDRQDACGAVLTHMPPAAGQGALFIEARADDVAVLDLVRPLDDARSRRSLECERELVRRLGADCRSALGAHASIGSDDRVTLTAHVYGATSMLEDAGAGADGLLVANEVAERLLSRGASHLLAQR